MVSCIHNVKWNKIWRRLILRKSKLLKFSMSLEKCGRVVFKSCKRIFPLNDILQHLTLVSRPYHIPKEKTIKNPSLVLLHCIFTIYNIVSGEASIKGRGLHILVNSYHCKLLMCSKRRFWDQFRKVQFLA